MEKTYLIDPRSETPFRNVATFCVGTGRIGLALSEEYLKQLALVQKEIGFSYIRGHGLFSDDMAIYQEYTDEAGVKRAEYNFTYLDRVMDSYKRLSIRPFLELGFMPKKMASGSQTIFYWNGNTTPPASYEAWTGLVKATLSHLIARYGAEEARLWPIEVWNEPNLPGFWKDADRTEYFRLFKETFLAVKSVDARLAVGGPAICGVDDERWMRAFLDFCRNEGLRPDFITRHHYTSETPERDGHYAYVALERRETCMNSVLRTREIVDADPDFSGLPIHITEFNTSYCPNAPIHDTAYNAAYTAYILSRVGDVSESCSYWTFGDVFEELGVPFTPFHGGFGLVANGCVPKPTFWTFRFFREMTGGACVLRDENCVVVRMPGGELRGVAWNIAGEDGMRLRFRLPAEEGSEFCVLTRTVDETHGNPLKIWHDLGESAHPSEAETDILRNAARPYAESARVSAADGGAEWEISLGFGAVCGFMVKPSILTPDRGYDYARVTRQR